jgi:hypothetical protein
MNESHSNKCKYVAPRSSHRSFQQMLKGSKHATNKVCLSCEETATATSNNLDFQTPAPTKEKTCVKLDPENVEKGLAQLVLTVIELLRQLMERQAVRRMEQGSLSDEQIERVGQTFIILEEKITELREHFHIKKEDLNINLGPLGNLM